MKTDLFPFQVSAAERILGKLRADKIHLLEAGMGTGKTLMSLALFEVIQQVKAEVDITLILAPKTLLSSWVKELEKHMDRMPFYVIWDAQKYKADYFKEELKLLVKHGGIFFINIEAFGRTNEPLEIALKPIMSKRLFLILDESSRVKDQGANRTQYISVLFDQVKYKLAMTGTLNANSPLDVYGQFMVLGGAYRKGKGLTARFWGNRGFTSWFLFRKFFAILEDVRLQGGVVRRDAKIVGYRKLEQLASMIAPYVTVIKKDEVLDLPDKVFEKLYVDLSPPEEKAYEDMKRKMMTMLTDGTVVEVDQKISLYQKFRQLCGGWIEPMTPVTATPAKLSALVDYLSGSDEQFVIFAVYTHEIEQIVEALGHVAKKYDGSVAVVDRQAVVDDFNSKKIKYIVVQPMAGAFGLNLQTSCNNVIYYSRPNSPEVMEQSQDRIHRIGQNKTCFYLDIVARDRIDEKVIEALEAHQDLSKLFSQISAKNIAKFV